MKKNYHHPTFVQYKKNPINLFPLYRMKKNYLREKKKSKEKKKLNICGSGCESDSIALGLAAKSDLEAFGTENTKYNAPSNTF
jgi:hypothetical protein